MRKLAPLFLLAAVICAGCSGSGADSSAQGAAQHAEDVVISESQKGTGNWLLRAHEADFYNEPSNYVNLKQPHLTFNAATGGSEIKAAEGSYDMDKNLITMTGRVEGESKSEGVTIKTEKAFYDTNTKKIWINTNVTITRAGITVKGKGLKANAELSEIEIFKQQTTLPKNIADLEAAQKVAGAL